MSKPFVALLALVAVASKVPITMQSAGRWYSNWYWSNTDVWFDYEFGGYKLSCLNVTLVEDRESGCHPFGEGGTDSCAWEEVVVSGTDKAVYRHSEVYAGSQMILAQAQLKPVGLTIVVQCVPKIIGDFLDQTDYDRGCPDASVANDEDCSAECLEVNSWGYCRVADQCTNETRCVPTESRFFANLASNGRMELKTQNSDGIISCATEVVDKSQLHQMMAQECVHSPEQMWTITEVNDQITI